MASRAKNTQNWWSTILVMAALAAASVVFGAFVVGPFVQKGLGSGSYETQLALAPEAPDIPYGERASASSAPSGLPQRPATAAAAGSNGEEPAPTGEEANPKASAPSKTDGEGAGAVRIRPRPGASAADSTGANAQRVSVDSVRVKARPQGKPGGKPTPKPGVEQPKPAANPGNTPPPTTPSVKPKPTGAGSTVGSPPVTTSPTPGATAKPTTYYRVRVGDYASRDAAAKARGAFTVLDAKSAAVTPGAKAGRFELQAGVFKLRANAERVAKDYRAAGASVRIVEYTPEKALPGPKPDKPGQ